MTCTTKRSVMPPKAWEVVIHSTPIASLGNSMNVFQIANHDGNVKFAKTPAILRVDSIDEGVSMINTGPCRYIAINVMKYISGKSNTMIALSKSIPTEGKLIPVNILRTNDSGNHMSYSSSTIKAEKIKKLADSFYFTNIDGKTCFIAVK